MGSGRGRGCGILGDWWGVGVPGGGWGVGGAGEVVDGGWRWG